MKKLIFSVLFVLSVLPVNRVFASPELVEASSGLDEYETKSSDENFINPSTGVENLEKVISNQVELSKIGLSSFSKKPIISGINDEDSLRDEKRICPYCFGFLMLLALILTFYGEKLRMNPEKEKWFSLPIIFGLLITIIHTIVHDAFASSVFNNYYWMLIYDELLIAYFVYSHYIIKPSQRSEKLTLRKVGR